MLSFFKYRLILPLQDEHRLRASSDNNSPIFVASFCPIAQLVAGQEFQQLAIIFIHPLFSFPVK